MPLVLLDSSREVLAVSSRSILVMMVFRPVDAARKSRRNRIRVDLAETAAIERFVFEVRHHLVHLFACDVDRLRRVESEPHAVLPMIQKRDYYRLPFR